MKNKKDKANFNNLQKKMFLRTIVMILVAIVLVFALYKFFLQGNFANWVVAILRKSFDMDFYEASEIYQTVFRNNMPYIFLFAISIIFLITFSIYLKWFVKYFDEINKGMDSLIEENTQEVILSGELKATENKINAIKHSLEKQKMDAQLAEQRKNDLIVYLAHDLKTPLASVIGYLNLLNDETQISDELRQKYLSISLNKAERLEDLINEFFEIARFNLSNITLQYSNINLTLLLEQLVFEFNPALKEKNLTCTLNIPDDTMINCDPDKIQRVFDNLLRNAIIYSFNDSNINISVNESGENLIIEFSNFGNTISKEKLDRIFEQFFRLDASRSTNSGGAGLGLAIAKQIIELHHGAITAQSEDEKISFIVTLPIS